MANGMGQTAGLSYLLEFGARFNNRGQIEATKHGAAFQSEQRQSKSQAQVSRLLRCPSSGSRLQCWRMVMCAGTGGAASALLNTGLWHSKVVSAGHKVAASLQVSDSLSKESECLETHLVTDRLVI